MTSPTLLRQIDDLLQMFPKAAWHAYEPIDDDNAQAGAALAFGKPLQDRCRGSTRPGCWSHSTPIRWAMGPDQLRNARGFAAHRQPQRGEFSRIYSIEAAPTLTGAKADHRIALQPQLISEVAIAIARSMGAGIREASLPDQAMRIAKQAAADLSANRGGALVLAGRALPPETHALVHWINAQLQAPVDLIEIDKTPGGRQAGTSAGSARATSMPATSSQLVMIGANPGYDAPADLEFAKHSAKAGFPAASGTLRRRDRGSFDLAHAADA